MPSLPSGTVTFLFTDIEGSTRLWEQHPRAMELALAQHHTLLRQAIEAHSGQVFQIIGDAFCAAFPTAPAALQATLAAQRSLRDAAWDVTGPIRVRMALHTAAVELHDGEYPSGQHFNRVARILHLGHGGQLLLSLATEQLVRDLLPPETYLRDLGQGGLRGLSRAEHVFQLVAADLPADFPALKDFDTRYLEPAQAEAGQLSNPYKGLRAFHEADAPDFFGREALTERLLGRLAEDVPFGRFLAVVGPSGSGKSSVVRAGLAPALRQGRLPGSERWLLVDVLPGAQPLEELEAVLLSIAVNPPETLLTQLREDQRGLIRAVKRVLPRDETVELVLLIDQFEEVFTLLEDEPARVHFLMSLHAAVTDLRSRLRVIVTLRADFYDRPLLYPDPGELLRERTEVVLPLTGEELERAIERPAARVGVGLEGELLAAIMSDVGEQPGALPLLQYALTELFERRAGRVLTLVAYRESGGVLGALTRRADELYEQLDEQGQEAARQLFLRLVTLGEGVEDTRRRVRDSEFGFRGSGAEEQVREELQSQKPITPNSQPRIPNSVQYVIESYGRYRLLTFDHDPLTREATVELAHEALIRHWGRLRNWLEGSREDVRVQRRLAGEAKEWASAGREASFLASGARLAQFAALAAASAVALNVEERAFLEASLAERDRVQRAEAERSERELAQERATARAQRSAANRLRYLVGALAIFLVVALGLSTYAFQQRGAADQQRRAAEANGAEAERQRGEAQANLTQAEAQRLAAEANFAQAERLRLAGDATAALDRGGSGDLAALLSIDSLRYGYSSQADAALLNALGRGFVVQRFTAYTATPSEGSMNPGSLDSVAFSPDGRYVLTSSSADDTPVNDTTRLRDVVTGQEVRVFAGLGGTFSPDGKYVLTYSVSTIWLWDVATGQEVRLFKGSGFIGSVVFSPDGRYVLAGGDSRTVRLWDVATGQELRVFSGDTDAVLDVAFAPDGKTILTGGEDDTGRLWDVATGHQLRAFSGQSVAFAPDGKTVLTGSADKISRLWEVETGKLLRLFVGHTGSLNDVAFSPDGKYVLTGSDDRTARLWDVTTGRTLRIFSGHLDAIRSVAFSPDGRNVLTGSEDQTARLWYTHAGREPRVFTSDTNGVMSAAFSSDGKYILTGSVQKLAELWDAQTGAQLYTLAGDPGIVSSVALSPDGRYALTIANGNRAWLWDVQTGEQLRTISGYTGYGVASFSPDGTYLLASADDHTARLWDVATGHEVRQFAGHADGVSAVAFSSDGKLALTGSTDESARLWDAATGQELHVLRGHSNTISGVAFSPDGKLALTGSLDKTARLWDVASGRQLQVFSGHADHVTAVAFAVDGKYVLTGSEDKTARLWDAATGQEVRRYTGHTDAVTAVAFAPDGKHVLTGSTDKTARLWLTDVQDMIKLACSLLRRDLTAEERAQYGITDETPTCPAR